MLEEPEHLPHHDVVLDAFFEEAPESAGDPPSFASRLRRPETIISFAVPIAVLVLLFNTVLGLKFGEIVSGIMGAQPILLVLAFLAFYAVFPLRGFRWQLMLHGAHIPIGYRDATEILSLSWFTNCVLPAKLGDVYRAFLLRKTVPGAGSSGLGTVAVERALDLIVAAAIAVGAGFMILGSPTGQTHPVFSGLIVLSGIVFVGGLVGLILLLRFREHFLELLPLPASVEHLAEGFLRGLTCLTHRNIIPILVVTVTCWALECLRLFLVIAAVGLLGGTLDGPAIVFLAVASSLLAAIPLTPAGVGLVEAGIIGLLTAGFGLAPADAALIAVLDRLISTYSIMALGLVFYALSGKTRGSLKA